MVFAVITASSARERLYETRAADITFAVVGVINTAVDLTMLNTLIAVSHRGRSGLLYSVFKAISFLVAVLNSYRLNSRWMFRYSAPENAPA